MCSNQQNEIKTYLWRNSAGFEKSYFCIFQFSTLGVRPGEVEEDLNVVILEELFQAILVHLDRGDVLKENGTQSAFEFPL